MDRYSFFHLETKIPGYSTQIPAFNLGLGKFIWRSFPQVVPSAIPAMAFLIEKKA
jgi:hypothetical protein